MVRCFWERLIFVVGVYKWKKLCYNSSTNQDRLGDEQMKKLIAILLCLAMLLTLSACERGEKGDKGDKGAQGEQGAQGAPGAAGVGIEKTEIINGELIVTYTDGTKINLGKVVGSDATATDENPQGLDFYPFPDGTYGVMAGNALYLEEITVPATYKGKAVTQILPEAFISATNLKKIVIADNVKSIGKNAFSDCESLESVSIHDLEKWCEIDFDYYYSNPLYYADKLYVDGGLVTEITIPSGVQTIKPNAFCGYVSLTKVTIPDSVTSIGSGAFRYCSSLASISIPDSVESIGSYAFSNCSNLPYTIYNNGKYLGSSTNPYLLLADVVDKTVTNFTIPNTTKVVSNFAFFDCSHLASITIPDSVTSIGDSAFYGCSSLASVTIGNSVTSIDSGAFYYCSSLASVYYNGTASEWADISISSDNSSLTSATIYYYSATAPTTAGNYWRYVGGTPTPWENQ